MNWIDLIRIFFALVTVLGMIGLCAVLAKRFNLSSLSLPVRPQKRLAIVESLNLDTKRRLAIVRCDDREHLIILGAQTETLLEQNIPVSATPSQNTAPESNPFRTLLEQKLNQKTVNQDTSPSPTPDKKVA